MNGQLERCEYLNIQALGIIEEISMDYWKMFEENEQEEEQGCKKEYKY